MATVKTQNHMKQKDQLVKRVIVERNGRCVINSPVNPPSTREEVERQRWTPIKKGWQSFRYDDCGVVIVSV